MENDAAAVQNGLAPLQEIKHSFDPAVPLLGSYPR
jgi:hypothetical protein